MKFFKKEIIQISISTIFSLVLLFPTAVKLAHTFEGHEHQACTDFSVHIHKKQLDCSICDFHFSNFNFTPQELPEFAVLNGFHITETIYLLPKFNKNTSYYFLRGPPLLS
ncbi:hypothetical protein Aeqsu_2786 [Aequorivita sublithincola DSM 14238]|uniref:Uncharacterized protein n=1 Tax=Aequorivita sublithincola (strain DSM 14238 / LMG 21431 / ACAM 643 / 9-3) TaxID=746697 RepID=I3YZ18_AEQSU|nr:hypothetical protein [Aequorivita sublithincola]AFL82236.1 hypothetical protein Aeqsu_2786 [Aequorivita sublithincola DSM 14238]